MLAVRTAARSAALGARRVAGRVKIASVEVDGIAPQAVLRAIRGAALPRPSAEERAWIRRIELMRAFLSGSGAQLEIEDFGAGGKYRFDTGEEHTRNVVHKTLGRMTDSSLVPRCAYLLFRLVRELQPQGVIEMGACVGISACYEAAALELNGSGRLLTLEGSEVLAERSSHTIADLDLAHRARVRIGHFADTLTAAIAELEPVGFAFIDGNHVEKATVDYMNELVPHAADEAVLVFDDINWSPGMRRAWASIVADPRFAMTVDMGTMGLAVVSASATGRTDLTVPY